MEERNLKISLETAKKWYNSKDENLVKLALQVFDYSELESSKLPKSWEEFGKNGYLSSKYFKYTNQIDTLEKLLILRDVYRQGWKPNYSMGSEDKWEITFFGGELTIECVSMYSGYFVFETKDIAFEFLNNFKDDLINLKNLL